MNDLKNKVALVTGGARDIGRAVSLLLASRGAAVVVNYFDNPDQAASLVGAPAQVPRPGHIGKPVV